MSDLIAEARAVIESERCVRGPRTLSTYCLTHDEAWHQDGQPNCPFPYGHLHDTATKLLAALEAVTAALSVRAQTEALDRVLAQPMSLDELRAELARAALTPKEE